MGVTNLLRNDSETHRTHTMKVLVVLALMGCAFARPAYDYVDPDCIEEDLAIAEPGAYDSALGEPELIMNFNEEQGRSDSDFDDCEDLLTTEEVVVYNAPVFTDPPVQKAAPTEECEDALTTEEVFVSDPPVIVFTDPPVEKRIETEPNCVDETTEGPTPPPVQKVQTTEAEDCIDDDPAGTEENPFLNFHVEKAPEAPEAILMAFDSPIDEIEECDDY